MGEKKGGVEKKQIGMKGRGGVGGEEELNY